jgi:hypothetical protein
LLDCVLPHFLMQYKWFNKNSYWLSWSHFFKGFTVAPSLGLPLWNICVTNDHVNVPLVVSTSRFFPHSWLITGFVNRLTQRMPLVEQELLTFLGHLSSPPSFSGIRVTRSLVVCVCFVDRCLSLCPFSFGHCVFCLFRYTDSDYQFGIFKLFLHTYAFLLIVY